MAQLVFGRDFLAEMIGLESGVQKKVLELTKKFEESTVAGIHLEKLNGAVDERIRTVRVDLSWRGVVARLGDGKFALLRVMPHDDAISWALKQRLGVNPATGIIEIIDVPTVAEQVQTLTQDVGPSAAGLLDGISDKVFRQLGIDDELVPLLRLVADEESLLAIASLLPKAQGDAVLMLADGQDPDAIWTALAEEYLLSGDPVDTDDIDAALDKPASRAEFVVTSTDQELMALLTSDFEAWRTFLHPMQRVIAEKPSFNGPFRLTGGAGTGKTIVAIHRARFLARQLIANGDATSRILIATYTTSLAKNLERTLKSFCSGEEFKRLQISTVDSLASQTLSAAGHKVSAIEDADLRSLAEEAATMEALDQIGIDGRYLLAEWNQIILGRDLRSVAEYATTPRPGRGRRLSRAERKRVWSAVANLTDSLESRRRSTYVQIAARAAERLLGLGEAPYAHVIVDEAQDLHPAQWRLLRAAVAPSQNDLFIVGDAHQRIYDSRVSLSSIGIETRGRSKRLKINYRTSQQILGWALGILSGEEIDDLDGQVERQVGYRSEFQGPAPTAHFFTTAVEESGFIAETITGWLATGVAASSIGVVARLEAQLVGIKAALDAASIEWAGLGASRSGKKVHVGTMHSSKGLEFARLMIAGASADRLPPSVAVTPQTDDATQHAFDLQRERCLLYVASTRARDELVVTGVGTPSELLPRLVG